MESIEIGPPGHIGREEWRTDLVRQMEIIKHSPLLNKVAMFDVI